jgi:hypothetical protein
VGDFAKFGENWVIPLAKGAKLHGTFRQILSPHEIRGYATFAKSVAKTNSSVLFFAELPAEKFAAGAWPVTVTCYSLIRACQVGHSDPAAPMLLVCCQGWGWDQPQAPMAAKAGGLLWLSLYRQISTGWETLVAHNRCFTVLDLVAKSVAKHNWPIGFCRQISPRFQNLKQNTAQHTSLMSVLATSVSCNPP